MLQIFLLNVRFNMYNILAKQFKGINTKYSAAFVRFNNECLNFTSVE